MLFYTNVFSSAALWSAKAVLACLNSLLFWYLFREEEFDDYFDDMFLWPDYERSSGLADRESRHFFQENT